MTKGNLRRAGLLALALLMPVSAEAADFISGTYSTEDGCKAMMTNQAKGNYLYLKADGITGDELQCDFLSVAARSAKPGWVATTLCEEPTISYPELVSIVPREDGRLQVAASQIADVDLSGFYQQCDAEQQ